MSVDFSLAERLLAAYPLQKVSTRRGIVSYREAGAGPALCLLHGISSQSGAVAHGIARALLKFNPELRVTLKKAGHLTRDPREKERKKAGQPGARKRFQFSKR